MEWASNCFSKAAKHATVFAQHITTFVSHLWVDHNKQTEEGLNTGRQVAVDVSDVENPRSLLPDEVVSNGNSEVRDETVAAQAIRNPETCHKGGILLFGPPGTGKTMLAKAIANEAGASFINVSMSTITSKWFGEDEKNVRALFTLAAKVSPTIIFVDEVDSMLGQCTRVGEHEAMWKIKNEFMTHWDGLMTKPGERILVLAATNRPFDLDEAIIRRFEPR